MCGRYAASRDPDDLVEEFDLSFIDVAQPLAPDWNVAPTKDVYAVLVRPPRPTDPAPTEPSAPGRQARRLRVMRWGLVPSWAPDDRGGARLVNARVETAAEKPAFRAALRQRRCILPADGYYEWMPVHDWPGARKQACFIRPRDAGVLAMAGIYELWRDPARPAAGPGEPGTWLWTCAVLTTSAEDELGHVHDRMPLVLERDRYAAWLDPTVDDVGALADLLTPATPGRLEVVPVSARVGDVRNNGPELVERVEPAATAAPTLF